MPAGSPLIAAVALGLYATLVGTLAPAFLARFWPADRAPRLTLVLLHLLSASFLIAAAITCLAFAVAGIDRLAAVDPAIDGCVDQLPVSDKSPLSLLVGRLALAAVLLLAVRMAYSLIATFGRARFRRRSHASMLRMLARPDHELGVLVLDHPEPACYCLPGRRGGIVITTGALDRLTEAQLQAVLHHERAHLKARHHLMVALAVSMRRTVPRVRLLAFAEQETRRLVELIADDAAARESGAPTVAAALAVIGIGQLARVGADGAGDGSAAAATGLPGLPPTGRDALARGTASGGVLAIDSSPTVARVVRLIGTRPSIHRRTRAVSVLTAATAVLVPVVLGLTTMTTSFRPCPAPDGDRPDQTVSTAPVAAETDR